MSSVSGISRVTAREKSQLWWFTAVVVALHGVGWTMAALAAREYPVLMGLAGLAYTFGLRHAFDADHIAAIDNTTRKLMEPGRRPFGVGFFFALGHSTVVLLMTLAIALVARSVAAELPALRALGSYFGTTISGVFLYAMGIVNLVVLIDVYRVFRAMRRGQYDAAKLEATLMRRGVMNRWLGGLFRLVSRPRQMYWVGLLFGLGFDTATEVALLTTAGVAASQELPLVAVLSLPIVFAAGMTLLDSADGILMCGAYGWAFANPLRKVFYNLTITGLSVVVALFIGTIQLVSIVTDRILNIHTGIWGVIQDLDVQTVGYLVAGLFAASWLTSLAVWRFGRLDDRWSAIARD
jgi:high-affinity nickel-transport protein